MTTADGAAFLVACSHRPTAGELPSDEAELLFREFLRAGLWLDCGGMSAYALFTYIKSKILLR